LVLFEFDFIGNLFWYVAFNLTVRKMFYPII